MIPRSFAIGGAILAIAGIASFALLRSDGGGERKSRGSPAPSAEPAPAPAGGSRRASDPAPVPLAPRIDPGIDPVAEGAADPASHPPIPGTERSHYEAYLARFRALGDETDPARPELLARFLDGETEPPERVGMLRASYDADSPLRTELFAAALALPPDEGEPGAEPVPSFAVGYLGDRLAEDPAARAVLEAALFDRPSPLTPELRRRGISRLVAASSAEELADLRPLLAPERDDAVRRSIAAELAAHPEREAAERLARALGLELPAPLPEREE